MHRISSHVSTFGAASVCARARAERARERGREGGGERETERDRDRDKDRDRQRQSDESTRTLHFGQSCIASVCEREEAVCLVVSGSVHEP